MKMVIVLFLLPAAALGTISPAMAKLVIDEAPRIGRAVGTVYALGSLGSIVGTFLAGFLLIPLLGVRSIVAVVGGTVGVLALLVSRRKPRAAFNPHTGEAMKVPARRWPRFAPGKGLRTLVRSQPERPARARGRRPGEAPPPRYQ